MSSKSRRATCLSKRIRRGSKIRAEATRLKSMALFKSCPVREPKRLERSKRAKLVSQKTYLQRIVRSHLAR